MRWGVDPVPVLEKLGAHIRLEAVVTASRNNWLRSADE
jgi:hypothetical protein